MKFDRRELAVKIAFSYLGLPYYWGGDDPLKGFDCSGFVVEILKSTGILPHYGDWTANDLYHILNFPKKGNPSTGYLAFWGNQEKMTHVEFCLDEYYCIGASGGGSKTDTVQEAIDQNAYIKVRPITYKPTVKGFVDPFDPYVEKG